MRPLGVNYILYDNFFLYRSLKTLSSSRIYYKKRKSLCNLISLVYVKNKGMCFKAMKYLTIFYAIFMLETYCATFQLRSIVRALVGQALKPLIGQRYICTWC
jgi:hypothetical protein